MHGSTEDWGNDLLEVQLALSPEDIDRLMRNLYVLRKDPARHFHLSLEGEPEGKLGGVVLLRLEPGQQENMSVGGCALYPGEEIPDPPRGLARIGAKRWRAIGAGLLGWGGVLSALGACVAAFVTVAGNDYRPVLIEGAWESVVAILAFHAAALLASGWKARAFSLAGSLLLLIPLSEILSRLGVL